MINQQSIIKLKLIATWCYITMKAININFTAPNLSYWGEAHWGGRPIDKNLGKIRTKKQKKNDPIIQIIISRYRRYYFLKYKLGVL